MAKRQPVMFLVMIVLASGICLDIMNGAYAKTTVTLWHDWVPGSNIDEAFKVAAREFETRNPDIKVNIVPNAGVLQKVTVAVAGGAPPDIFVTGRRGLPSYVAAGLIQPLDDLFMKDKLSEKDFWPAAWWSCKWGGKIWTLPWGADPNFGFFYNRGMFGRAGIPENKPPRTIRDLDEYNRKLARRDSQGRLIEFGVVPWWTYGYPNSMYTWGWAFGGEFYDEKTQTITPDDPKVVKALEWMVSIANLYGGTGNIDNLNAGRPSEVPGGAAGLFAIERLAMAPLGPWELPNIQKHGPDVEFGITFVPYDPDGAEPNPTWVGGHGFFIPAGAKHKEAAWKLLRFLAADPDGTALLCGPLNWFPGYNKSKLYDTYRKDRLFGPFVSLLETARHLLPMMPASEFYYNELGKALSEAITGKKVARQALLDAKRATEAELQKAKSK